MAKEPEGREVVGRYMTREVLFLSPRMNLHEALNLLLRHEISGAPVLDERGRLVGILTERDIIHAVYGASYHADAGGTVEELMSREVRTLDENASIAEAADLFLRTPYRRFPVLSGTRVVGLISRRDVLRALRGLW